MGGVPEEGEDTSIIVWERGDARQVLGLEWREGRGHINSPWSIGEIRAARYRESEGTELGGRKNRLHIFEVGSLDLRDALYPLRPPRAVIMCTTNSHHVPVANPRHSRF